MVNKCLYITFLLLFLFIALNNFSHCFAKAYWGIVTTRKHKSIKKILYSKKISSLKLCRCSRCSLYLIWYSIYATFNVNLVFFAYKNRQIAGHYFTERGNLYLFLLFMTNNWLIVLKIIYVKYFCSQYFVMIVYFY